jgi:hypothetical protein
MRNQISVNLLSNKIIKGKPQQTIIRKVDEKLLVRPIPLHKMESVYKPARDLVFTRIFYFPYSLVFGTKLISAT